jgi:hypothetical protein
MHAAALNLTTKVTVSQRFLVVGLPQRGAEAALATALGRPEEGIENVHGVAGHRLAEAFQRGCFQHPRAETGGQPTLPEVIMSSHRGRPSALWE